MTILLFVLSAIALFIGFVIPKDDQDYAPLKRPFKIGGTVLITLALAWEAICIVPAGHRAVLLRFGAVTGELQEGFNVVTPFVNSIEIVEVQTQKEEATASAASRDLQTVTTRVAINYHIEPNSVGWLYKNVGLSFPQRIIDPAVQEVVKAIVAKYTAEELIRDRATVKGELDDRLTARLAQYNLIIENQGVSLKDFQFSKAFNDSIEAKQVAQQTAEKAKYLLQQAEIDAQTKVTEAKGQAEANRIRAAALNTLGGGKVLSQQWIEKWDGHVPSVMSAGSGGMMLNLGDLMSSK